MTANESKPQHYHHVDDLLVWSRDLADTRAAFHPPQSVRPNPVVVGEVVIAALMSPGELVAVKSSNGNDIWRLSLETFGPADVVLANGRLYFSCPQTLYSISSTTGDVIWSWSPYDQAGEWIYSSPIIIGDRIILGDRRGVVHCLTADSGTSLWKVQTSDPDGNCSVNATAVATNDRVITATNAAVAIAYDLVSGKEIWKTALDGASTFQLQLLENCAIVQTTHSVYFIDCESGSVVKKWSWPAFMVLSTVVASGVVITLVREHFDRNSKPATGTIHWLTSSTKLFQLDGAPSVGMLRFDENTGYVYETRLDGLGVIDPQRARRLHHIEMEFPALPSTSGDAIYCLGQRIGAARNTRGGGVLFAIRHPSGKTTNKSKVPATKSD